MPLDRSRLWDFLELVGKELSRPITLVAAGGTAMTLLDIKPTTLDVDFTGPADDTELFDRTQKSVPHGFKVDIWPGGQVFSQFLPGDYLKRSLSVGRVTKIKLRALHPVDIVVTKIGRLNSRDLEDIRDCIKKYTLKKDDILERGVRVEYVGNQENYDYHLQLVIQRFFGAGSG